MASLREAEKKEHVMLERVGRVYEGIILPMIENRTIGWIVLIAIIGTHLTL